MFDRPARRRAHWSDTLRVGVERGLRYDAAQADRGWCCHVQYAELMKDPVGSVRRIYAHFGDEVSPLHARRMERWMQDRPQQAFGRHVYRAEELGLSRAQIDADYAEYRAYSVPSESCAGRCRELRRNAPPTALRRRRACTRASALRAWRRHDGQRAQVVAQRAQPREPSAARAPASPPPAVRASDAVRSGEEHVEEHAHAVQ